MLTGILRPPLDKLRLLGTLLLMKQFRQVFTMGPEYVFRIALPGCRFVSLERFPSAEAAAFRADLFKTYLVAKYSLDGKTMWMSMAPSAFAALLGEAGVNPKNLEDIHYALPQSCKDYLLDGGHETLTAFVSAQAELTASRK